MIRFQPHTRTDIPLRVKWLNNRKATIYAVDNPEHQTNAEEQRLWFDAYENSATKSFFTIYNDEKPIGFMGLSNIDLNKKQANVFILIGEDDYRGKGIGKISLNYLIRKSFDELELEKLELEVDKRNTPAINLNMSLGFAVVKENEKELFMELKQGLPKDSHLL